MMNHPGKGAYEVMSWPEEDLKRHIGFMKTFAKKLAAAGELVMAEGLGTPDQAKLIRAGKDGQPPITDGVFPESKEFLVGFWIVDVETTDRAIAIATEASSAPGRGGKPMSIPIEMRQVMSAPPVEP
jgi:hypothetical protein